MAPVSGASQSAVEKMRRGMTGSTLYAAMEPTRPPPASGPTARNVSLKSRGWSSSRTWSGSVFDQCARMPGRCSLPTTATMTPPAPSVAAASKQRCAKIWSRSSTTVRRTTASKAPPASPSIKAAVAAVSTALASLRALWSSSAVDALVALARAASALTRRSWKGMTKPVRETSKRPTKQRSAVTDCLRSMRCVCAPSRALSRAHAACALLLHVPTTAPKAASYGPPSHHHPGLRRRASFWSESVSSGGSGRETLPLSETPPCSRISQTGRTRSSQSSRSVWSGFAARTTLRAATVPSREP
mmetsp:Transcript_16716/g.56476  ORF Transcript_16716/g.56476 Transcript_16716/m.56476 type:complete len:301 (-) Transcript_16716:176-1078(-)